MSEHYSNMCKNDILKRLECIESSDYSGFFNGSENLWLALCLAYIGLSKEKIVKDEGLFDKELLVDEVGVSDLFENNYWGVPNIYEKSSDSYAWFISMFRNAIFHSGIDVDMQQSVVHVNNSYNGSTLKCDVPFNWLVSYANRGFSNEVLLKHCSMKLMQMRNSNFVDSAISNDNDLLTFLDKEVVAFDITFDAKADDKLLDKISLFSSRSIWNFKNLFEGNGDLIEQKEFDIYRYECKKELDDIKENFSDEEYENILYETLYIGWIGKKLRSEFPDYNVSVSKINNNALFNYLKDNYSGDYTEIYNASNLKQQKDYLVQKFDEIFYNLDRTCVDSLYRLYHLYVQHIGTIKKHYGVPELVDKILDTVDVYEQFDIENELARNIHEFRTKNNLTHSYEKRVIKDFYRGFMLPEDYWVYLKYFNGKVDICDLDDSFEKILNTLKSDIPDVFQKYCDKYKNEDAFSDEDLDILNNIDIMSIAEAKQEIDSSKPEVITALLYVLGINLYVLNKQTVFDNYVEDYNLLSELGIKGFSKKAKKTYDDCKEKIASDNRRIRKNEKQLEGIRKNCKNLEDKQDNINALLRQNETARNDIIINEALIEDVEFLTYNGLGMASVDNKECAEIIRDCLSHCDRIFVRKQDDGHYDVELTDYHEGELKGYVKTSLNSLIKFLSHETFQTRLNEYNGKVSENSSTK